MTNALGQKTYAEVDPVCLKPKTTTDLNAQVTTWTFGRVRATEQWKDNSTVAQTVLTWDAADQLVEVRDPHPTTSGALGATWSYSYDTLGRRIWAKDPDLGETSFVYDLAGRLIRQTDARGTIITFAYDALSRVTRKRVRLAGEPEDG